MVALLSGVAGTVGATALTVPVAEAVDMSEVEPAGTVEVAGTADAAEVETVGTVEVVEAFGRQFLCAVAGGVACYQVSVACFVVPAPFSGADLS